MPKSETSLNDLLFDIRRIADHRKILTEEKIEAIYRSLMKDLNSFIGESYTKYADKDGHLYWAYLDAKRKRANFLAEIMTNVDSISPLLKKEMETLIDTTYQSCYKGMIEAVKKSDKAGTLKQATKGTFIRPEVLKQAVNNNIHKLTLPAVVEKHRSELIYQIQQELNIGLMNGARYEQMSKRVEEVLVGNGVTKGSQGKAKNIVRTESHRNVESGFMDCAEHIQEELDGSDLIYAATWRTMKDEAVRPQQRRKTKKGWKYSKSKNGANHMKMEGKTVKVGELFDLGNGVKAKAPSQSGVAAHDCNCRCFLEYNLMTAEEFAKATEQTAAKVVKKYDMQTEETPTLSLSDYPTEFTKGAEGKNTQKLIDYVNNIDGADPNALKLYASTGKLENIQSNGITFKISHAQNHAITTSSRRSTGELVEVKYTIPKFKGDNIAGQVNTTLHEQMHLLDLYGREDVKKSSKWFSTQNKKLVDTFKNTTDDIGDDIAELFTKHNAELQAVRDKVTKQYLKKFDDAADEYREALVTYKEYKKNYNKLRKEMIEEIDYESRNIMGGGVGNLQDIYDALSSGTYRANGTVKYGHGQQYYMTVNNQIKETVANYVSLSVTRPDLIEMLRKDKPELCEALDALIIELVAKAGV